jgi:LPXTG-site transpeptidase (sortase) family protein
MIVVGALVVVVGVAGLAAAANLLWGHTDDVRAAQRLLAERFDASERHAAHPDGVSDRNNRPAARRAPAPPLPGYPVARMDIPRIGEKWLVVEGIKEKFIADAPGHYPGSAMAGEVGNFVVIGHRAKGLFWDLDKLQPGDPIVVQARQRWYVYHVVERKVVPPRAMEEIAPVPGQPRAMPTKATLTLSTCEPRLGNSKRLVVHADLVRSQPTSDGYPRELSN